MMNNFAEVVWDEKVYDDFLSFLKSNADKKYNEFNSSLMNDNSIKYLGVRIPILKKIAKEISKGDYPGFLKYNTHETYEERIIHGKLLSNIKVDFNNLIKMLDDYMKYASSWALVDCVIMKYKQIKGNEEECLKHIERWIASDREFEVRTGLNMLFTNFINNTYIDIVLNYAKNVRHEGYYVKMMNAWMIAECFIKFRDETLRLLSERILDSFTQNKAVQKIRESYRVTDEDKQMLIAYKKPLK